MWLSSLSLVLASIVPYSSFPTADSNILIGGGNDKLFGILCQKLGRSEWIKDDRFETNAARVTNRKELERMVGEETQKKTTKEWLEVFEGCGMPYAPVNDVWDTLHHEHCECRSFYVLTTLHCEEPNVCNTIYSTSTWNGPGS